MRRTVGVCVFALVAGVALSLSGTAGSDDPLSPSTVDGARGPSAVGPAYDPGVEQRRTTAVAGGRTIGDAPVGTVFVDVRRRESKAARTVGLLKRGRTGNALYNPSRDFVALDRGDILVARDGREYRVSIEQQLPGGTGAVGPDARVYPGETGLRFVGFPSRRLVSATDFRPGRPTLDLTDRSISVDQQIGTYEDVGVSTGRIRTERRFRVFVTFARVVNVRLFDDRGQQVEAGSTVDREGFVVVRATVNFLDAEPARVVMVNPRTGDLVTTGALSRREALDRFPESADVIRQTVPEGKARLEGPDGTRRSLANPAHDPNTTVYLIQDLRAVDDPGRYEFVVEADTTGPFGDLVAVGAGRTVGVTLPTVTTTVETTPATTTAVTTTATRPTTTAVTTTVLTPSPTATETPMGRPLPGFGVVALVSTLAVLVAVSFLARRR
jgi:hypothetical protein